MRCLATLEGYILLLLQIKVFHVIDHLWFGRLLLLLLNLTFNLTWVLLGKVLYFHIFELDLLRRCKLGKHETCQLFSPALLLVDLT